MKRVAHSRRDALQLVEQATVELGTHWEPPQLVEIKRYRPPRSLPQNAKAHAMINELADWSGAERKYLKDHFKREYGPQKLFSFGGVDKMIPMSSTEYTREQMTDFIGHIERVGAELGYRFSDEGAER